ncbi:MAG: hypothetical protein WEC39_00975 [Patescibacteria group bacterium]
MGFLTKALIEEAIAYALPTVRMMILTHTWGPKGVVIAVDAKGIEEPVVVVMPELGPEAQWANEWPGKNFQEIAIAKARLARRLGMSTRSAIANHLWSLEPGDYLYPGGVAENTDVGVGVSGAYGDTDESAAWVIWNLIYFLCSVKRFKMEEAGIKKIQ